MWKRIEETVDRAVGGIIHSIWGQLVYLRVMMKKISN